MATLFIVLLSVYCLLLVLLLVGWVRVRRQAMPARGPTPRVSVIIAVRNEAEHVENLLRSLASLVYPTERFEIILVNDHSTDRTAEIAKSIIQDNHNTRILDLPENKQGKKEALAMGIKESRFEVIATTDADCRFSKNWLTCLGSYFELPDTMLLTGGVRLTGDGSFFSRLQIAEFSSLIASTAAAIGLGYPLMCNGANLSFRKKIFEEVRGYEGNLQFASGDDEFLMRKVARKYPGGVKFLNYYEAAVTSHTQKSLTDFFHQRIRWAGKWRYNVDVWTRLVALFVLVAHVSFVGLVVNDLLTQSFVQPSLILKVLLEGVFVFWAGRFLGHRFDVLAFLCLQILYPVYAFLIGVISLFSPFRWKDRKYGANPRSQG